MVEVGAAQSGDPIGQPPQRLVLAEALGGQRDDLVDRDVVRSREAD